MLFIDGHWIEGRGIDMSSHSPHNGTQLWTGASATDNQVNAALEAATEAFQVWSFQSFEARLEIARAYAGILKENKDKLTELISMEAGKTGWDAAGEATAMINKVEISVTAYQERTGSKEAVNGTLRSKLSHRPYGVMAVFGPYNFPGHLPNGHIVPALLAGNTIVFKPSELTPAVAEFMVSCWEKAGLPHGVLNLVHGGKETGVALTSSPLIQGVLFTGSAQTGIAINKSLAGRPEVISALEMGGNNPLIVHKVDDLEAAATLTILSAYISSGQRCTCARRLIVPEGPEGDAFIATLANMIDRIHVDQVTSDETAFMGPVITKEAADHVLKEQERLIAKGGAVIRKSERLSALGDAFLSPGLIDVSVATDVPDEEIFGPLLQLTRVSDFDEAIKTANRTKYGLASGLISDDRDLYEYFYPRAQAGIVNWNQQLTGAASTAPFGGLGHSGNHRPSAYYAADYCAYGVATIEQAEGKVVVASAPLGLKDK
ncbi:succinylglutamate-semialdehyde dehydrogenase [Temperatibacter marinus]|uniref:Succinylglutamate-semialdehyde dehydrogenase n=1 Tax=Temperatibacter marinus TaxID=1456591 RepID=A0AA52EER3_9PROT|nr:succinylglutamate-semialdehyde dehydrogenase [Temperatibacter marinus]WND01465.1 succinylglutamate-semialdehyde dehydrogenase [Temperatibacter marinus]